MPASQKHVQQRTSACHPRYPFQKKTMLQLCNGMKQLWEEEGAVEKRWTPSSNKLARQNYGVTFSIIAFTTSIVSVSINDHVLVNWSMLPSIGV